MPSRSLIVLPDDTGQPIIDATPSPCQAPALAGAVSVCTR